MEALGTSEAERSNHLGTLSEETNKDYRFYDLLPQQQVTPIPDQAIPETKDNPSTVVIVEAPAAEEAPLLNRV